MTAPRGSKTRKQMKHCMVQNISSTRNAVSNAKKDKPTTASLYRRGVQSEENISATRNAFSNTKEG